MMSLDPSVYRCFAAHAESSKLMHSRVIEKMIVVWTKTVHVPLVGEPPRTAKIRDEHQNQETEKKKSSGICAEDLAKDAFGSFSYALDSASP